MTLTINIQAETFPIAGKFIISRGAKTEARVVTVTVSDGTHAGRGECVPYARYGETVESVIEALMAYSARPGGWADRLALQMAMKAGAARNALDCALWDLGAKASGVPVRSALGLGGLLPLTTAYTLSLGSPAEMAAAAKAAAHRPLLKIKVGGKGDIERVKAVAAAAPNSRIILDANEGWTEANIAENLAAAAALNVALVEQPLPAGRDAALASIQHSVPICADESVHTSDSLAGLRGLYDAVNIKLDKSGGLTEALLMRNKAKAMGFQIMAGCMVGTSLAMAPALLLAQGADFVDLDGPLLLARDRHPALRYQGSVVFPPEPALWG
jgi:L-Ala-D/L-Glu epimerase